MFNKLPNNAVFCVGKLSAAPTNVKMSYAVCETTREAFTYNFAEAVVIPIKFMVKNGVYFHQKCVFLHFARVVDSSVICSHRLNLSKYITKDVHSCLINFDFKVTIGSRFRSQYMVSVLTWLLSVYIYMIIGRPAHAILT